MAAKNGPDHFFTIIFGNIDGPGEGGDYLLQGVTVHDDIDGPGGTIHVVMDCLGGGLLLGVTN